MKRPAGRPKDPEAEGKTEQINVRVSPETRRMLEKAADENGVKLSREIERRLASTFSDWHGQFAVTPETVALLSALKNVLIRVEEGTGARWHTDTFTCRGVAEAVAMLFTELEPAGDGKPPSTFPAHLPAGFDDELRAMFVEKYSDSGFGRVCAANFLTLLRQDAPADEGSRRRFNQAFPDERSTAMQVLLKKLVRRAQRPILLRPPHFPSWEPESDQTSEGDDQ